jgi:hypothetical protein
MAIRMIATATPNTMITSVRSGSVGVIGQNSEPTTHAMAAAKMPRQLRAPDDVQGRNAWMKAKAGARTINRTRSVGEQLRRRKAEA